MYKRLLIDTQLSNYNPQGKFIIEADSGWQMMIGRVREMLRLNADLHVDVLGPDLHDGGLQCQVVTHPFDVNPDLWARHGVEGDERLRYIDCSVLPNALVTRYDFDWPKVVNALELGTQKIGRAPKYDVVFVNDPMRLRALKAAFHVVGGYQPKFVVHSHFVDCPSAPKFPQEASLWLGQCEAAIKADLNFWQCQSALRQFELEARMTFRDSVVDAIMAKSEPWDDGYSSTEINVAVDMSKVRFTYAEWLDKTQGKDVLFFPNRISPSSGDYTNGMKFMFELLPRLRQHRQDFVVVCGNPNQKFSNEELTQKCGKHGYVSLVPDTLNRDEYKFVAAHSDVALGFYDNDTFGGTAARECVDLGCMPLWLDCHEYAGIAREVGESNLVLVKTDFSDLEKKLFYMLDVQKSIPTIFDNALFKLQVEVKRRCSYEQTTAPAMKRMDLL